MEDYTSEREQIDEIKKWWNANGKAILIGLLVGLSALFGYRYWESAQNARAESASLNYQQFLTLAAAGPSDDVNKVGQSIIDGDGNTVYARLTALLLARLAVDDNKLSDAKRHLQWVIEHGGDSELVAVARARLAQILLTEGQAAAAWTEIKKVGKQGERELFAEIRGDILAALGKGPEAQVMYTQAIADVEGAGGSPELLEMKRDALGTQGGVQGGAHGGVEGHAAAAP